MEALDQVVELSIEITKSNPTVPGPTGLCHLQEPISRPQTFMQSITNTSQLLTT